MAGEGGSAKLGEARVDIVADDRSLRRGLTKAKNDVNRFAIAAKQRMGSAGGGGGGGGGGGDDGSGRYSFFGKRGPNNVFTDFSRIRSAVGLTFIIGAIATVVAKLIDTRLHAGEDATLGITGETVSERLDQATKKMAEIEAMLAAQDGSTTGMNNMAGRFIDAFYNRLRILIHGDQNIPRNALNDELNSLRKAAAELAKQQKEQRDVSRLNDAADKLDSAAERLNTFGGNTLTTTISQIQEDLVAFRGAQNGLYYGPGAVFPWGQP